jgi:hypothetical protein
VSQSGILRAKTTTNKAETLQHLRTDFYAAERQISILFAYVPTRGFQTASGRRETNLMRQTRVAAMAAFASQAKAS